MGRKHESPALDTNVWAIPSSNCAIKFVLASSAQRRSRGGLVTQLAFDGGTTLDCRHFVQFVMLGSIHLEQYAILLVRVFLGLFFAISGARKLFVADGAQTMYETLIAARVPLPRLMTYFVSAVEFVGGVLLVTGFLSTLACAALAIDMVVAIVTTKISAMPKEHSAAMWFDNLLFISEVLYVLSLFWLICSGPGTISVDHWLAGKLWR